MTGHQLVVFLEYCRGRFEHTVLSKRIPKLGGDMGALGGERNKPISERLKLGEFFAWNHSESLEGGGKVGRHRRVSICFETTKLKDFTDRRPGTD